MKPYSIVLSGEHAGNQIPAEYEGYFSDAADVLESHRGWDPGSKEIAEQMSEHLNAWLYTTETSRLLVECNRSLDHPDLFSEYTRGLSDDQKELVLSQYYYPHRRAVQAHIQRRTAIATVVHLSIHTFTPVWKGQERKTDIGLLFDETRARESALCAKWRDRLQISLPDFQIDFNKPYLGSDDGFTTYLRTQFDERVYLGIEIEVNQKFNTTSDLMRISASLCTALLEGM